MPDLKDLENRFTYHPPRDDRDVEIYQAIRSRGLEFALLIGALAPESRELSLAITHIEDAVMWANAAIARHGRMGV
jgi:hypothetical protein